MSDARVLAIIERMEAWLADATWEPDADALACWNADLKEALAQAEKATGWADLVVRAHAAGHSLEARSLEVAQALGRLQKELEDQERGNRALKGYRASTF
jgi:hypothetical protein